MFFLFMVIMGERRKYEEKNGGLIEDVGEWVVVMKVGGG